jgi:zinc/manganese transport system substrate-binding protein
MRNRHVVPMVLTAVCMAAVLALASDKLRVVATTPDLASVAQAVGGDAVEVTALARPTEDPHFVDPKPSYIVTLNKADVLIEGGAGLEAGWLPPLLDGARNPRIALGTPGRVVAAQGIGLLDVPPVLDRSMGDVHQYGNPHYLLDPVNAKVVAQTIATALCAADHERCDTYAAGARQFGARVDAKMPEWQALLGPARGTKVVTYHKDFDYFAQRFGLDVIDTLEPKPGIPPSPTHLAELIPKMKAQGARIIIAEPNRERQNPEFVAEKTGADILLLPIMPGSDVAVDYIGLIDYNVRQVAAALNKT